MTSANWADARGRVNIYNDGPDRALELRDTPQGAQWTRFVHGDNIDQPLAMEVYPAGAQPTPGSGQIYYFHPDAEGSIRLLTDTTGNIANLYDYDSFGRRLTAVESVSQPYGWKAREFLPDVDLYYNRARFYDPVLGRFIAEDPIGYASGDMNLYNYAWNNPAALSDPSGLSAGIEYGTQSEESAKSGPPAASVGQSLACLFGNIASVFEMLPDPTNIARGGMVLQQLATDKASCGAVGKLKLTKSFTKNFKATICRKVGREGAAQKGLDIEDLIHDVILNVLKEEFIEKQVSYDTKTNKIVKIDKVIGNKTALEIKGGFRVDLSSSQRKKILKYMGDHGMNGFFFKAICK